MRGLIALVVLAPCAALAQQPGSGAQSPTGVGIVGAPGGHLIVSCNPASPGITGGTLDDGSTDCQGSYVSTNAAGTLTFAAPYLRPPICDVTPYGGAAITYFVSNTGITLSQTSGVRYAYQCFARPGG